MPKYLHNLSEDALTFCGRELPANSVYRIPVESYSEYAEDSALISAIDSAVVAVSGDGETVLSSSDSSKEFLKSIEVFRSSLAVDKDGTNQTISDITEVVLTKNRVLWDFNHDYDDSADDFVVEMDGVYAFDIQLRMVNFINCKSVELAVFKRGDPDDYWFILDKKEVGVNDNLQLGGSTLFDFYKGDRICIKVKLTKISDLLDVSADIDGSDDYTAWGYNFVRSI